MQNITNHMPTPKFSARVQYTQRQKADIEKYGKKNPYNYNVPNDTLQLLTPHRRLSLKPCSLSDPNYFIKKFEQSTDSKFLPNCWAALDEKQKINYIVKKRYRGLVANKIMNHLKDKDETYIYGLDYNGDIVTIDSGKQKKLIPDCQLKRDMITTELHKNDMKSISTSVVNHPFGGSYFGDAFLDILKDADGINLLKTSPFTFYEIHRFIKTDQEAYLIDKSGNRYHFQPFESLKNDNFNKEYSFFFLRDTVKQLYKKVFGFLDETLNDYVKLTSDNTVKNADIDIAKKNLFYKFFEKINEIHFDKLYLKTLKFAVDNNYGKLNILR